MKHRCDLCFDVVQEAEPVRVSNLEDTGGLDVGLTKPQQERYRVMLCQTCIEEHTSLPNCVLCGDTTRAVAQEDLTGFGFPVPCCRRCFEKAQRNSAYGETGWD